MRKVLFAVVTLLVIVCAGVVMIKGVNFGNTKIYSIKQINEKNEEIDNVNKELTSLTTSGYKKALESLNSTATELEKTKKEYENKAVLLSNNKYYGQSELYKIEFLFARIGNYARDNYVEIKMDVTNSTATDLYDLNFSVVGRYSDVAEFISNIENDSRLGFKIENFSMTASTASTQEKTDEKEKNEEKTNVKDDEQKNKVLGKFSCKEIRIDLNSLDVEEEEKTDEENNSTNEDSKTSSQNNTTEKNSTNLINIKIE